MKKVRVTGVQNLTPSMRFLTTFLNFSKLISSLKAQVCNISRNYIDIKFFYLKIVGNEKVGGSRRWHMIDIGLGPW
jgi:hypothetical protein